MFPHRLMILVCLAALGAAGCASTPRATDPGAVAAAYAEAGRYDEASREIEVGVRSNPNDVVLRRKAADIQAGAGNPDRAVAHLETAIELAPAQPSIWLQLAELEKSRDNFPDAYVAFRRATELAPDDIRAVSGLALTAEVLNFDEEAKEAYDHWAELERRRNRGTPRRTVPRGRGDATPTSH
jgi:tetratricopeptide (TPR) repeat protein